MVPPHLPLLKHDCQNQPSHYHHLVLASQHRSDHFHLYFEPIVETLCFDLTKRFIMGPLLKYSRIHLKSDHRSSRIAKGVLLHGTCCLAFGTSAGASSSYFGLRTTPAQTSSGGPRCSELSADGGTGSASRSLSAHISRSATTGLNFETRVPSGFDSDALPSLH